MLNARQRVLGLIGVVLALVGLLMFTMQPVEMTAVAPLWSFFGAIVGGLVGTAVAYRVYRARWPSLKSATQLRALYTYTEQTVGSEYASYQGIKTLIRVNRQLRHKLVKERVKPRGTSRAQRQHGVTEQQLRFIIQQVGEATTRLGQNVDFIALAREVHFERIYQGLKQLHNTPDASDLARSPWVHALLRVDAICNTYYPATDDWWAFRMALSTASSTLRMLVKQHGHELGFARLLASCHGGENSQVASPSFIHLTPVQQTLARYEACLSLHGDTVIDCVTFELHHAQNQCTEKPDIVLYNPAEWEGKGVLT